MYTWTTVRGGVVTVYIRRCINSHTYTCHYPNVPLAFKSLVSVCPVGVDQSCKFSPVYSTPSLPHGHVPVTSTPMHAGLKVEPPQARNNFSIGFEEYLDSDEEEGMGNGQLITSVRVCVCVCVCKTVLSNFTFSRQAHTILKGPRVPQAVQSQV